MCCSRIQRQAQRSRTQIARVGAHRGCAPDGGVGAPGDPPEGVVSRWPRGSTQRGWSARAPAGADACAPRCPKGSVAHSFGLYTAGLLLRWGLGDPGRRQFALIVGSIASTEALPPWLALAQWLSGLLLLRFRVGSSLCGVWATCATPSHSFTQSTTTMPRATGALPALS